MNAESEKSEGRNWARIAWITAACLFVILIGTVLFLPRTDPTPTVYHRTDGTFSLNRPNGPNIAPKDLFVVLKNYDTFGQVRLVCNPLTKISDWHAYLDSGGQAGAASYVIESGQNQFSFSLPSCSCSQTFEPLPTIINLSDIEQPSLDADPGSDVIIFVNPDITSDKALEAAREFEGQTKSISIIGAWIPEGQKYQVFLLHPKHDHSHKAGTFRLKNSTFWNDYIQPVTSRIRALF